MYFNNWRKNFMSIQSACSTEYDVLDTVILCEPTYMKIREVINETQKVYEKVGIDREIALEQHGNFIQKLIEYGVKVKLLPAYEQFPEQVFTRDIGFTLGDTV